jgi:putative aldouronate transport system permease protein
MQTAQVTEKRGILSSAFDVANYLVLALLGIVTLGPFLYLLFGSLTTQDYYRTVGVSLLPSHWSLGAYDVLLGGGSRVYQSLKVTVFETALGTVLSLMINAGLAYGLAKKELPGHKFFIFFVFFTFLFSGGFIPFYLVVKLLGMVNTIWALIFPMLVNVWYLFIMMKFFETLPRDIEDAARIDGASELSIFWQIVLPLSKPVLAAIGLFYAVDYWNQWFWATVFLTNDQLFPLQLMLRGILDQTLEVTNPQTLAELARSNANQIPPNEILQMAAIVVTILPIALVYPFLQRYFVQGILIGSIKG